MKKYYKNSFALCLIVFIKLNAYSQCASSNTLGASSNIFTLIRNSTNPIAADKNLNTIIYLHRNNASGFGGSSGNLRYDISTNAGVTWTNNIGVLNPLLSNPARYPNVGIYNPVGNTNINNAYINYLASTISSTNSAWNGQVTGVQKLNGTGTTENYNQTGNSNVLISHSLVKGAPGIFWSVDAVFTNSAVTGFRIYKGTWNGNNDITWTTNFTASPSFNTAFDGLAHTGDYNIAFDPTGNVGWMSFLSHLNGGPTNYAYYPIFYKTTDGGNSWSGPIQVDINQFSCATSILTGTNVITTAFEHDLTVDINGNPHLLTTFCNGNNGYSVFFGSTHRMFDVTQYNGLWNVYDIANVNAGRGGWGTSTTNTVTMDLEPQISRTSDGKKVFFSWADNTTYTLGAANQSPNLMSKGFDVTTNKWTNIKDFTSCNVGLNGLIYYPHVAEEVLEPNSTSFKLAPVYAEFTVPNDPSLVSNFKFIDNAVFNVSDFSVSQPSASVSIVEGSNWLLCSNSNASLSIGGTFNQILWSNGTITNSTTINTPGNYFVTARNGCTIGADTIAVNALTVSINTSTSSICSGNTASLNINSNALSYTWTPGSFTTNAISVNPTVTTVFTITTSGNNCSNSQTSTVIVNSIPTITASISNPVICAGASITLSGSGANTYTWSGGALNGVAFSPSVSANYTLTGTSSAGCTSTNNATQSVTVNSLPTVNVISSNSIICFGQSATLTASGANTYSWNTGATTTVITVTPNISTAYSVIGTNTNNCSNTNSITILVSTCTGLWNNELDNSNITIYPNPTNGEFKIKSNNTELNLLLLNNLGQLIKELTINSSNNYQLSINDLSAGIYLITGSCNNQILKQKIIITK